jgi:histone-lysine N-methyltransferase SETD1
MALCLYRQKAVRFGKSKIHRWGVFAAEALRKDDMLLEYRGEAIGNAVAEIREKVRRTHP